MIPITGLISFLQACVTPVALISGVGILVLTLTNRLGRIIDRVRILRSELDNEKVKRENEKKIEIGILYKRAKRIRTSIALITLSIICSSLIIPVLAISILGSFDVQIFGYVFFSISILSFIVSAFFFFSDVMLSLKAIKLEITDHI
jgi:hypothetical protein